MSKWYVKGIGVLPRKWLEKYLYSVVCSNSCACVWVKYLHPIEPAALGCIMYKLPEFLVPTLVIKLPFSHIHSISPKMKLLNIILVTKYDLHIYIGKNDMFVYEFDVEANLHSYST